MILGATGSGKSFFLNFLITNVQKYQPLTYLFDLGGSYESLTQLFGGSYVQAGIERRSFTINPFRLPPTPLAKAHGLDAAAYAQRQAEIAAANNLTVVDGKIPLPDLRIEYEGADGEQGRVDLELATEHYRAGQIAEKSRAGFKMYSFVSTSRGLRAEWGGRELTAGALAL